jgi:cell division protein ZapA
VAKHTYTMTALGSTFTLRSDDDPGHLRRVADFVTAKVEEVQRAIPTASPLKVAMLTALNIADDLLKERGSRGSAAPSDAESREILAITQRIISNIDESLDDTTGG